MSSALTRRLLAPALTAAMCLAMLLPGLAVAKKADHADNGKGKVVNVMTRNLYLGADLAPVIAAQTPEQVVTASGAILRDVIANDFPTRAEGLADEILRTKPDLVGLQEVALWQTTPITPAGTALTIDYLDLLLDELNKGPDRYEVVVVQNEFGTEVPADANGIEKDDEPVTSVVPLRVACIDQTPGMVEVCCSSPGSSAAWGIRQNRTGMYKVCQSLFRTVTSVLLPPRICRMERGLHRPRLPGGACRS